MRCSGAGRNLVIQAKEAFLCLEREPACSQRYGESLWGSVMKRASSGLQIPQESVVGFPGTGEDVGVLGLGENGVLCLTGTPAGSPAGRVGKFPYSGWE